MFPTACGFIRAASRLVRGQLWEVVMVMWSGRRWTCLCSLAVVWFCIDVTLPEARAGSFKIDSWRELVDTYYKINAAQFLSRTTFGPTEDEIEELANQMKRYGRRRAMARWIEAQFRIPASNHHELIREMLKTDGFDPIQEGINHTRYRHHAWWHIAIRGEDQLRQRMAWALAQIFVVGQNVGTFNARRLDASGYAQWMGITNYYDMLAENAFGNYRELLHDVTYHPVMGIYLSHIRNRKPNPARGIYPDENYAREVMQLFSIGLYEMRQDGEYRRDKNGDLIPTYDNETIKAFARVFTGLSYPGDHFYRAPANLHAPMQMYPQYHDTDPKTLLRGQVVHVPDDPEKEIEEALDNIFHHPNVGPFIARRLIQRLVKSNPSRGYIRRVARRFARNRQGERGDFKAVLRAILLDREALRSTRFSLKWRPLRLVVSTRGTEFSRLREPVLRYTAFIRAFRPESDYANGYFMLPSQYYNMNQGPYLSPHVFNFYDPDYQPPGDITNYKPSRRIPNGALVAPEFEILTSVIANRFANRLRGDVINSRVRFRILGGDPPTYVNINLDFQPEADMASDTDALMEHLDLLLCHGTMSDKTREIIANALDAHLNGPNDALWRARAAILAVLTCPECACDE